MVCHTSPVDYWEASPDGEDECERRHRHRSPNRSHARSRPQRINNECVATRQTWQVACQVAVKKERGLLSAAQQGRRRRSLTYTPHLAIFGPRERHYKTCRCCDLPTFSTPVLSSRDRDVAGRVRSRCQPKVCWLAGRDLACAASSTATARLRLLVVSANSTCCLHCKCGATRCANPHAAILPVADVGAALVGT